MTTKQADPAAIELDDAFAAAMSAPAKPREAPPPPEVDRDAPHGRDDQGVPLAPYGHNKDGSVRKSAAGRRVKDEAARTGTPAPPGTPAKAGPPAAGAQDFSGPLGELHDALWLGISGLSMIGPRIPVIGRKLPADKLAAEAYIWRTNRGHLVKAAQITADHNAAARARLAKLAEGNTTWVLMAGFTLMPFIAQTAAVFSGDDALAAMNPEASVAALAGLNQAEWQQAMERMRAEAVMMAAQAEADVEADADV